MNFAQFQRRALEIFHGVPEEFREGITALVVHRKRAFHPQIRDYVTLGECVADPFSEEGPRCRSTVHLYYGSFVFLAKEDPGFDFEDELRETILHEIRHQVEDRAGAGGLLSEDCAEEENEKRRAGLPHRPFFYRAGEAEGPGEYWVGPDCFVEIALSPREWERHRGRSLPVEWKGIKVEIPVPDGDPPHHLFKVPGGWEDEEGSGGDLVIVLLRRKIFWDR